MKRSTSTGMTEPARAESTCPNCDSTNVRAYKRIDTFNYGVGQDAVRLSAEIPAYRCGSCGLEFSGEGAEHLRHRAVCEHLGLLTPARITSIRARYGLSRAKFAAISRIGMATLARWESGETLQNAAMDVYMRLLARPDVYDLVVSGEIFEEADSARDVAPPGPKERFRSLGKLDPAEQARRTERSQGFWLDRAA